MQKIIYTADVIAKHKKGFVIIRRNTEPKGLALPGGKKEDEETLWDTAIREFEEETGLKLEIDGVLGTYAEEGRDPRGNYVSTVFVGLAFGNPKNEETKTKVLFYPTKESLVEVLEEFVFDHAKMIEDYFKDHYTV